MLSCPLYQVILPNLCYIDWRNLLAELKSFFEAVKLLSHATSANSVLLATESRLKKDKQI
jgi:hypothetical protein